VTEQQLALALEVPVPVARPPGARVFSALQFAAAAKASPKQARAWLADFAETGVVEKVGRHTWRFTPNGRAIARDLMRWTGASE
jgi:hypothetical protein